MRQQHDRKLHLLNSAKVIIIRENTYSPINIIRENTKIHLDPRFSNGNQPFITSDQASEMKNILNPYLELTVAAFEFLFRKKNCL